MDHRELKNRIYPHFARIAQALASESRLELVDLLSQAPRDIESLAGETGMPAEIVSLDIQMLLAANLVSSEQRGNIIVYELAERSVASVWLALRGLAEARLPEVRQLSAKILPSRDNGQTVPRDRVSDILSEGAQLLDVRPADEFAAGHLTDAVNIPIEELPGRLSELPSNRRIITYCRGEYCMFSDEAAEVLRTNGFDVVRLQGGWLEWQAEGRPTKTLRTILFTDLVDHAAMMSRLGDERGRDVLRENERVTREMLRAHSGTEVKTMGDGFMASFGSVSGAVECAVALQKAFAARDADERLDVRVGLNAGEPIEETGDLFGATVILASRIAAKAQGGEILVADTVRGLCSGKGFLFCDRGDFVPKGFDEPLRVYEVKWRDGSS